MSGISGLLSASWWCQTRACGKRTGGTDVDLQTLVNWGYRVLSATLGQLGNLYEEMVGYDPNEEEGMPEWQVRSLCAGYVLECASEYGVEMPEELVRRLNNICTEDA